MRASQQPDDASLPQERVCAFCKLDAAGKWFVVSNTRQVSSRLCLSTVRTFFNEKIVKNVFSILISQYQADAVIDLNVLNGLQHLR